MLSVVMMNVVMLSVVMLSVVMLSVVMLSAVMLSAMLHVQIELTDKTCAKFSTLEVAVCLPRTLRIVLQNSLT